MTDHEIELPVQPRQPRPEFTIAVQQEEILRLRQQLQETEDNRLFLLATIRNMGADWQQERELWEMEKQSLGVGDESSPDEKTLTAVPNGRPKVGAKPPRKPPARSRR